MSSPRGSLTEADERDARAVYRRARAATGPIGAMDALDGYLRIVHPDIPPERRGRLCVEVCREVERDLA